MGVSECEDLFPLSVGYEPSLMQLDGRAKDMQKFMNPYDRIIIKRNIPQLKGKLCLGCFEDWLLLVDKSTKAAFFLHRTLDPKLKICLPPLYDELLKTKRLGGCVISSSPTSRKCMVVIVGRGRDVIIYCRPKMETSWTKVSLPVGIQESFTGQVARFKGKIYILHGDRDAHRVVVINEDSLLMGCCRWTILQMPNRIAGGWYYLVISGRDLFLVLIATSRLRDNPINYTIYRLETSDRTWERVKSIGGCVFFLGGIQSTALTAAQAGTQRDCIYVVNQCYEVLRGKGVYKICLRDQNISHSLVLESPTRYSICNLCWVMPTRTRKSKRETLSFSHFVNTIKGDHAPYVPKEYKKEEKCIIDITRAWADMPNELVQLLLPHLYLVDCLRLPSIFKAWNSLYNPIQDAKIYPWLMYPVNNNSCLWRLFDPVFEKEYYIDMKWLGSSKDLTFHYSKDGWVFASEEDNSLFLINPLTRAIISLPHFDNFRYTAMSFSSAPTCLDCVVFVLLFTRIHVLEISTWSPGEGEWSKMIFNDHEYLHYLPCSPVFAHGEFYCYRLSGELSVYNPKEKTLRTIETKAPLKMDLFSSKLMDCHLIESDGGFITVFRNRPKDPIRVFKLDQPNMVWSEIDGVGDITIFLDHRTSIATSSLEKRCRNLIYLSVFTDDYCRSNTVYSLETNKYHPDICYNLKQPINCIWIEPSLTD